MSQEDANFDNLQNEIEAKKVIPVIGYDLLNSSLEGNFENKDLTNPNIDLLEKIANLYDTAKCEEVKNEQKNIKNGFELITGVYHKLSNVERRGFGPAITKKIIEVRDNAAIIPTPFELLAKINKFRFYINTTILDTLEQAVSTYKVPNPAAGQESNYDVITYNTRTTAGITKINYDLITHNETGFSTDNFLKPTIYNIVGTYNVSKGEFAVVDVDLIELIYRLFKDDKFEDLKSVMSGATLLFIGCDFPDWFFRFFIRFCSNGRIQKENINSTYCERLPEEPSKTFFSTSQGIIKFDMNPSEFVIKLFNKLNG